MPSRYEKYLDDIIEQRKRKPFQEMASSRVQQIVPEIERTRTKVSDTLRREGASSLAKARFALDAEGRIIDEVGKIYSEADIQEIARQEQLGGEQRQAQLAVDQEKEAKKKADKARTQQVWKTAAEIAGTVGALGAGIAAAPLTAAAVAAGATGGGLGLGMGTLAALGIGKAAGGVADVVTGLDKTYESPESIVQGGANIISGVMTGLDTISQENFMSDIQKNLGNLGNLNSNQWKELMFRYQTAVAGNNRDRSEFSEWLANLGNQNIQQGFENMQYPWSP